MVEAVVGLTPLSLSFVFVGGRACLALRWLRSCGSSVGFFLTCSVLFFTGYLGDDVDWPISRRISRTCCPTSVVVLSSFAHSFPRIFLFVCASLPHIRGPVHALPLFPRSKQSRISASASNILFAFHSLGSRHSLPLPPSAPAPIPPLTSKRMPKLPILLNHIPLLIRLSIHPPKVHRHNRYKQYQHKLRGDGTPDPRPIVWELLLHEGGGSVDSAARRE